jgi:tetratricopeptide (TPR) repeat protein
MKEAIFSLSLILLSVVADAQSFPRASQYGEVEQTIGITEVEVEYFRPNKRDRKIFGELVPYGEIWRTGANEATKIEFSLPLKFAGNQVDSGAYALFTIPGEKMWTVILNKNYGQWGSGDYDSTQNVATAVIPVVTTSQITETFSISFDNVLGNMADLILKWDNVKVVIPIETELDAYIPALIEKMLQEPTNKPVQVYTNAARYYLQDKRLEPAAAYISKALTADDTFWLAWWVNGQILQENGKTKEALKSGEKAIEMGEKYAGEKGFPYSQRLRDTMIEWK